MEDLAREAAEVILLVLAEVGLGDGTAGGGRRRRQRHREGCRHLPGGDGDDM